MAEQVNTQFVAVAPPGEDGLIDGTGKTTPPLRVSMNLTTVEKIAIWFIVRNHYGDAFSNSDILWDLVRIKGYETKGERSNRFRLDQLDQRLDRLEQKFDHQDQRLDQLEQRMGRIEQLLEKLVAQKEEDHVS